MAWILQAKSSLTGIDPRQDYIFAQQGGTHHVAFNKDVPKVQGQDFAKGQGRAASSLPRVQERLRRPRRLAAAKEQD